MQPKWLQIEADILTFIHTLIILMTDAKKARETNNREIGTINSLLFEIERYGAIICTILKSQRLFGSVNTVINGITEANENISENPLASITKKRSHSCNFFFLGRSFQIANERFRTSDLSAELIWLYSANWFIGKSINYQEISLSYNRLDPTE